MKSRMADATSAMPARANGRNGGRHAIGIESRREIEWDLHIDGLSLAAIAERLKRDHGIDVSRATICRDLEYVSATTAKRAFGSRFNPLTKVAEYVSRHESLAARAIRASEGVSEPSHVAALLKVAGAAYERAMTLMQDVGLVHRDLGVLRVDEPGATDRIPTGTELQKLFDSIEVRDDELVSEAERAWLYGDQAAAER